MSSWLRRKLHAIEQFALDVFHGRAQGVRATLLAGAAQGVSLLWNAWAQAKLWLYRKRILHDQPLGCLVVVVGNLTVGGTGKTPVVEKFAGALRDRGRKVAILSRGYRSKSLPLWKKLWNALSHAEEPPPRVVSDGSRVLLDSEHAGDEPYMLARNLPGVIVLVDKNRVKSGAYAIREYGCDTLVLDDGFQYLPLKGSLNLLLVDKTNPFGNGHIMPRGILREPVKHLQRADYVFLTKSNGQRDLDLEATIRRHHPTVDIIECTHKPKFLQAFSGDARLDLGVLRGAKVAAFSGIAVPESFERFLTELGAQLVSVHRFPDHYRFVPEDFEEISREAAAAGARYLVTTEKDAVRLPQDFPWSVDLYYLRLEIEILRGASDFQEAVDRLCFGSDRIVRV